MTPNYLKEAEEWISKECPIEYGQSKEAQRVRLFATHLSKKYGKEEKIEKIECNDCIIGREEKCPYHKDVALANKINQLIESHNRR